MSLERGERGPKGDHGQTGERGAAGPEGPRRRLPERWYRDVWLIVVTGFVFWALAGVEGQSNELEHSIGANCTLLSVLLENRADRDTTVKLFAPIRRQNPKQFDALVERAKKGDVRLLAVAPDLSCKISPRTLERLSK